MKFKSDPAQPSPALPLGVHAPSHSFTWKACSGIWSHTLVAVLSMPSQMWLCQCNSHARVTIVRIALDTSVLVAAARSRNGASFQLVSMLPTPRFDFALTIALYTEWQVVLTR